MADAVTHVEESTSKGSLWGHCSVISCSNGRKKILEWQALYCEVHKGSKHNTDKCVCTPPFRLWTLPTKEKNPVDRQKWIQLISRKNWVPSHISRVCSRHFVDGRPSASNPYPTQHLGYSAPKVTSRKPPTARLPLPPKPKIKRTPEPLQEEPELSPRSSPMDISTSAADHAYSTRDESVPSCASCVTLTNKLVSVQNELKSEKLKKKENAIVDRFVDTDEKVNLNTGVVDREMLLKIHNFLKLKVQKMRYWKGLHAISTKAPRKFSKSPKKFGPSRKLDSFSEFVLVLMKLRLGVTNSFLCHLFDLSVGLCSKIINTWVKFMAKEFKNLVYWPSKETILQHMPADLAQKYPQLRCTLDCTEIFIGRPRRLDLQQLTWSDYKKHNTVKYLVGIAPNGSISYLSNAYGGRSSDQGIVRHCGFLDLVEPFDVILADRGFTIAGDLLKRHARLEIPPPSSGIDQQTAAAVKKTKKVANARIHVERAIGRMKVFAILKNVFPINLLPIVDDIVFVCAALVNLRQPLVGN